MKILLITYKKYEKNKGGGEEFYIENLMSIFRKNSIDVDIFYLSKIIPKKKNNIVFLRNYLFNAHVDLFSKYDILINNTEIVIDKKYNDNVIWVQHSNLQMYKRFSKLQLKLMSNSFLNREWKLFIYLFLKNIFFKISPMKFYNNIAVYNLQHNIEIISKNLFYTYIPEINNIVSKNILKTKGVFYFGRLDHFSKNIFILNKIFIKSKINIDVFGDGPDISKLDDHINYMGFLDKNRFNILCEYKVALFPSFFEGVCISLHEIIEAGIIPIVSNFSEEINFIRHNDKISFLCIEHTSNIDEWVIIINKILNLSNDEYLDIVNELKKSRNKIYRKNIDFEQNWLNIVKSVYSKS